VLVFKVAATIWKAGVAQIQARPAKAIRGWHLNGRYLANLSFLCLLLIRYCEGCAVYVFRLFTVRRTSSILFFRMIYGIRSTSLDSRSFIPQHDRGEKLHTRWPRMTVDMDKLARTDDDFPMALM
jgi:hypothetical protein